MKVWLKQFDKEIFILDNDNWLMIKNITMKILDFVIWNGKIVVWNFIKVNVKLGQKLSK